MELKEEQAMAALYALAFQSHLYGIESWIEDELSIKGACFNRTFMELKVLNCFNGLLAQAVSIAPLWN